MRLYVSVLLVGGLGCERLPLGRGDLGRAGWEAELGELGDNITNLTKEHTVGATDTLSVRTLQKGLHSFIGAPPWDQPSDLLQVLLFLPAALCCRHAHAQGLAAHLVRLQLCSEQVVLSCCQNESHC